MSGKPLVLGYCDRLIEEHNIFMPLYFKGAMIMSTYNYILRKKNDQVMSTQILLSSGQESEVLLLLHAITI